LKFNKSQENSKYRIRLKNSAKLQYLITSSFVKTNIFGIFSYCGEKGSGQE